MSWVVEILRDSCEILINNNYIRIYVISCTQNDLIWIRQIGRERDVYIRFRGEARWNDPRRCTYYVSFANVEEVPVHIPRVFVIHVNSAGHATSSLARCETMSEPTKRLFVRPVETCLFPFQSGFSPSVLAKSMRPYVCQNSRKRSTIDLNGWHSHSPHRSRNVFRVRCRN